MSESAPASLSRLSQRSLIFGVLAFWVVLLPLLSALGRAWWCKCGRPIPFAWDIWSEHASQHLIDFYSPSHLLHGLFFFALLYRLPFSVNMRFGIALLIESAWEYLENTSFIIERYRSVTSSLGYSGDSIANSLSDVCMCALGFYIASRVSWRISIAIFLGCELVTTYLIRDGLLLNVLMLLYPLDGVRQWQQGGM